MSGSDAVELRPVGLQLGDGQNFKGLSVPATSKSRSQRAFTGEQLEDDIHLHALAASAIRGRVMPLTNRAKKTGWVPFS